MTIAHPLKWPGSHRTLAPRMICEALALLDGKEPTAIVDLTVGGGGSALAMMDAWPSARVLLADSSEPTARLWLDLSTAAGAADVEAEVAGHARGWAEADAIAASVAGELDPETRVIGRGTAARPVTARREQWARWDARRAWHEELRYGFNAANRRHLAAGPLAALAVAEGVAHSGAYAALLRGSYKGLCRWSARGNYNAPCAAELTDKPGRPLYAPGSFAALGPELERRRARVACADFAAVLAQPGVGRLLRGALVVIDPAFPGGFTAYSPGCVAAPISALADAAAWASGLGAAVLVNHPAEGAAEWRARLPGATIHVDLVRRGAMEPSPDAEAPRRDRGELLAALRPGVGAGS